MEILPAGYGPEATGDRDDVGSFRPGDAGSRWALGRYLLGRAIAVQVSRALLTLALVIAAVAVLCYVGGLTVLAVLIALVAVAVLGARSLVGAILRRTTVVNVAPADLPRLRRLETETRKDVTRELRRLGLPGRAITVPLLGARLASRRRRPATLAKLRDFDVDRVVPAARVDDLHLLLQAQASRGEPLR
jgi:hypothetical protein